MKYSIREASQKDLPYLAGNLRPADIKELYAQHGHVNAGSVLDASFRHSHEVKVGCDARGLPQCIYGIHYKNPRAALIWAVGTPVLNDYKMAFARSSRKQILEWFKAHPSLKYMYNFTHSDNHVHHEWLEWVGAELKPDVPFGITGSTFKPFIIRRQDNLRFRTSTRPRSGRYASTSSARNG